jgi:hypothetical protein
MVLLKLKAETSNLKVNNLIAYIFQLMVVITRQRASLSLIELSVFDPAFDMSSGQM